ncbi:hypothetical protein V8C40DRAFT_232100 [Trichoderma camerunense]
MLQPCIWAPPLWFERLQGPTSGPEMLMICGDEVQHRMESNRLWQSRMDEPWPGLSLAAAGANELVSQHSTAARYRAVTQARPSHRGQIASVEPPMQR